MVITPVPELVSGDYIVKSTTVSAADNDIDRKQWIFTVVAAASPSPSATPAPDGVAEPERRAIGDPARDRERGPDHLSGRHSRAVAQRLRERRQ